MKKLFALIKSILTYKCPSCRQSDLFIKPMDFKMPLNMHKSCNVCQQNFEPEPGFYYGAMFLSYIVGSFILLPFALFLVFVLAVNVETAMIFVIILGILLFFKLLRGSRSLWIHIMVKYNSQYKDY